jgi:hydrogenase nickel incorporation protein HypA/HybF
MHELSIALSIIELAEEEMSTRGGIIQAVHLKIGKLSGVLPEALRSSFELASERTALAGSKLMIEEVPVVAYCAKCAVPRPVNSVDWFVCPECRGPMEQVLQGKELQVVALEFQ